MAVLNSIVKGGDVVKSMSMLETAGAGAIGGIANGLLTGFLGGKVPAWGIAAGEIIGGVVVGGMVGGKAGLMIQNGLVITGMSKVSDFLVSMGKTLIGGGSTTAEASTQTNTTSNMY